MKSSLPSSDSASSQRRAAPKRTRAKAATKNGVARRARDGSPVSLPEIAALNAHPLNQHALALMPKWAVEPDDQQLHLLTLAEPAKFAGKPETTMLKKMKAEWAPSAVVDYFARVSTFEDLFLAQYKPLEAVQVILAAVDIIAEPHRYLPAFQLE